MRWNKEAYEKNRNTNRHWVNELRCWGSYKDCSFTLEQLNALLDKEAEFVRQDLENQYDDHMEEVSHVYYHVTDGLISKPNTYGSSVNAVHDDIVSKMIREERSEALEEMAAWLESRGPRGTEWADRIRREFKCK